MKIYRFDAGVSQPITQYGSVSGSVATIAHLQGDFQVVCIAVDRGGKLGYHQAVLEQLFLVVQGNGEVRGAEDRWLPIHSGQAAFWLSGEWHETRTESGLTAIVIEGAGLDPSQYLEEMA